MNRLRTPKSLAGPEAGLLALSFQAWHEARHGEASYADIERIGRTQWAEYLAWYRDFLGIPIRYGTTLTLIEPVGAHFRLHLTIRTAGGVEQRVETARKMILGNGVAGNGKPNIVAPLTALPSNRLAHTSDAIDFASLAGKSVAVVGGAASAFDAAATALEAGAADVHLFVRRAALAAVPVSRARAYPGAYDNFPALPDAVRWRQALRFKRAGSTAPADAVARVTRYSNFHLHLGAPWQEAAVAGDRVRARAGDGSFEFDFVIAGTGYAVDLHARPELAHIADHVLLWRERHAPAPDERDDALGAHPYLGDALEYLEKRHSNPDAAVRQKCQAMADLLTPVVKGWCTKNSGGAPKIRSTSRPPVSGGRCHRIHRTDPSMPAYARCANYRHLRGYDRHPG